MPKKTKRQKILAQLHRQTAVFKLSSDFVKSQNEKLILDRKSTYQAQINSIKNAVTKPKTDNSVSSYGFVASDLLKITIFTLFAAILQGVLYFLLRTR